MFSEVIYQMQSWTLNQIYDKIKNCKVVKPPYEWEDWIYNQDFFLDKRSWHTWFKENSWYIYTDIRKINWVNYYLYNNWTNAYIWIENWDDITQIAWPFTIWSNTPIRMAKSYWAWWTLITSWTISATVSEVPADADLQYYWDWWVKLTLSSVAWVTVWQYIQFWDWILKWWANYIYKISWSYIYIIGTNSRGSLPLAWASYKIFSSRKENIIIWATNWLHLINTNWTWTAQTLQLTTVSVDDIVEFNWALFYLAWNEIHFSRKTFDDNQQFYPVDKFLWWWILKLISLWKILLAIWDVNKAYAAATNTDNTIWYVEYDVNYQWTMFSKYSYMYADSTFYIVQADKQLVQIDIVTLNATTYDMITKNIEYNTRWLFEWITWWSIYVNHTDRYINFCNIDWDNTTIYQYDKQYQHWLINEFAKQIYLYWDKICLNGWVWIQSWDTDFWVEFEQEVNFMIQEKNKIVFPFLIRTNFWLTWTIPIDVSLDITYTEWANLATLNKHFWNYAFDSTLANNELEDLIWYEESSVYNWNTVSLQHNIFRAWRFVKFKFHSYKRFIIWESYIPYKKTKYYINEILQTN